MDAIDTQIQFQVIIIIGLFALIGSMSLAMKLLNYGSRTTWKFLSVMVFIFACAYGYLLFASLNSSSPISDRSFGLVLLIVAIYVNISMRVFVGSLQKIETIADEHSVALRTDPLTGLPNRTETILELRKKLNEGQKGTFFYINICDFKKINQSLGGEFADRVLEYTAMMLKQEFGKFGTISRMAGDEFGIWLNTHDEVTLQYISERLAIQFNRIVDIDDFTIELKAAVGYCSYPNFTNNVYKLLEYTSIAVAESKRIEKPVNYITCSHNNDSLNKDLTTTVLNDLAEGLLEVHYQPIVQSDTNDVVGIEALTRWPKKCRSGYISPAIFIPILEKENKISALTEWVIKQVAQDLPKIMLGSDKIQQVHINLSSKDLLNKRIQDLLEWHAGNTEYWPEFICIEITESAAFEYNQTSRNFLELLITLGYKISLDDFGTGYSSLSMLRELPISQVKLDRMFVSHIFESSRDYNIVKAMIDLSHMLGHTVVGEGVEDELTATELSQLGCDFFQGFYFNEPMSLTRLIQSITLSNKRDNVTNINSQIQHRTTQ